MRGPPKPRNSALLRTDDQSLDTGCTVVAADPATRLGDITEMTSSILTIPPRRSLVVLLTVLAAALLFATALRNPIAYDAFWHLRMGFDWLQHGLSPWRDHLSFTFAGEPIASPPYLFQSLLASLVDAWGVYPGFVTFKLLAFALVLCTMAIYLRQLSAPLVVWVLVLPLLIFLLQLRAQVRPELISYGLSLVAMALYRRVDDAVSWKQMLPIVFLLFVWNNWHSAIFGYVIFFALFIQLAVRQLGSRFSAAWWLRWAAWGSGLLAVGFLHPGTTHTVFASLRFDSEWRTLIQEFQSASIYSGVAASYALLAAASLGAILSLLQRRWGYLLILAILIPNALTTARLVTPAGLVVLCIVAHTLTRYLENNAVLQSRLSRVVVACAVFCAGVASVSATNLARALLYENRTNALLFPSALADHMVRTGPDQRILNDYSIGGYLAWRLSPESQVYIDGRTGILYPVEHYRRYLAALADPELLRAEIDRYGIDALVLPDSDSLHLHVSDLGDFHLDFVGPRFALFRRGDTRFRASGALRARPACWTADIARAVNDEWARADMLLRNAPHLQNLQLLASFAASTDSFAWLEAVDPGRLRTDTQRRFVGYRSLDVGLTSRASVAFATVRDRRPKDLLAAAAAAFAAGDLAMADQRLIEATRIQWQRLELVDLAVLWSIADQLRQAGALTAVDDEFLASIAKQLDGAGLEARSRPLDAATFCAAPGWGERTTSNASSISSSPGPDLQTNEGPRL